MEISYNEDNTLVTIRDYVKDVAPNSIFDIGTELTNLDLKKYALSDGTRWLIRALPALISRLIDCGWTINFIANSPVISTDIQSIGEIRFHKEVSINPWGGCASIVRWHGDTLIIKRKNNQLIMIPFEQLATVTAEKASGSELLKDYCPARLTAIKNADGIYIFEIKASDTRWLKGIVAKHTLKTLKPLCEDLSFDSRDDIDFPEILDHAVIKTPKALEYFLIKNEASFRYPSDEDKVRNALADLERGEILLASYGHYFSYGTISELENSISTFKRNIGI